MNNRRRRRTRDAASSINSCLVSVSTSSTARLSAPGISHSPWEVLSSDDGGVALSSSLCGVWLAEGSVVVAVCSLPKGVTMEGSEWSLWFTGERRVSS